MIIEEIKLGEHIIIYRSLYPYDFSKDKMIYAVKQNEEMFGYTKEGYGGQSVLFMDNPEFTKIRNYGIEVCKKLSNINETEWDGSYLIKTWAFHISEKLKEYYRNASFALKYKKLNQQPKDSYHRHPFVMDEYPHIKNEWSFCFYLKMPTDLTNEEGKFTIIDKDDNVFSIEVKEGDMLFFKPDVAHRPHPIPNSAQERISLCSNLTFTLPNLNKTKLV
jgi:hypothetical protein